MRIDLNILKKELKTPDSFWLEWEEYRDKCNGCGSGWNTKLVPDHIYGLLISIVCCIHDRRYFYGGTEEDKIKSDKEFLNNILIIIGLCDKWYYPKILAKIRAYTYYGFVKYMGKSAFKYK